MHQRFGAIAELWNRQREGEQPHATVDVAADAGWRSDVVRRLGRGHAADAVTLIDVRHRQRRIDDPRQRRDVLQPARATGPPRAARSARGRRTPARGHTYPHARSPEAPPHALVDLVEPNDDNLRGVRQRAPPLRGNHRRSGLVAILRCHRGGTRHLVKGAIHRRRAFEPCRPPRDQFPASPDSASALSVDCSMAGTASTGHAAT